MNWKHLRVQETFGCLQHWRAICLRNINKKQWKTAKKELITRPFAWDIFSIPTGFAGFLPYLPSKMNRNNSNTIFQNTSYYANRSGIYYTVATFINLPGRTINQCQSKMMKCQCQIHHKVDLSSVTESILMKEWNLHFKSIMQRCWLLKLFLRSRWN